jgi:hypothetical protein
MIQTIKKSPATVILSHVVIRMRRNFLKWECSFVSYVRRSAGELLFPLYLFGRNVSVVSVLFGG